MLRSVNMFIKRIWMNELLSIWLEFNSEISPRLYNFINTGDFPGIVYKLIEDLKTITRGILSWEYQIIQFA